jgi:tetratricopeptide (TPR) repeat protein
MDICPAEETIVALVAGRLERESRQQLQRHVTGCRTCQQRLNQLSSEARTRPAAPVPERPAPRDRYMILDGVVPGAGTQVRVAYDTLLDRRITLALLAAEPSEPDLKRVLGEAAAMARLSHPNLVTVHDMGVMDGRPFIAMELVDGKTLDEWSRQERRRFREIARVAAAAARGLAAAHAAGIVHRDVTPRKILVAGPRVLVTGFGLAGPAEEGYPTPERLRGEEVDARTDVFGLCATLFEVLHGEPPFPTKETSSAEVLAGRGARPLPRTRAPARLSQLALRGLDPDPVRRPTMSEVADALEADPAARWKQAALLVAAAAVLLGAFRVGAYLLANPERRCRAGSAAVTSTWNDLRRADLRQRYVAGGRGASWPVLETKLDQFVGSWRAAYGATCAAYHGRGQQGAAFDLRVQCLESQRAIVDAFLRGLSAATSKQLVVAAAATLPAAAECESAGRPQVRRLPLDPQLREPITAVQKVIAEARAQELLGDYARSKVTATQAIEAARKTGYQPVVAAALLRLAVVESRGGTGKTSDGQTGIDRAAALYQEAYAAAEAGGDDRLRMQAVDERVFADARRGHFEEGLRWARIGAALLARLGNPADQAARLAEAEGGLYYNLGQVPQTAAAYQRAVDQAAKMVPPDKRLMASSLAGLCATKEGDDQIDCFRRAAAMARDAYGPEHPETFRFLHNLGTVLSFHQRTHAEGCETMRKAIGIARVSLDPTTSDRITALVNMALCLQEEGRDREAQQAFEEIPPEKLSDLDRAYASDQYGFFLVYHRDTDKGLRLLRAAQEAYQAVYGKKHEKSLEIWGRLIDGLRSAHRYGEAHREVASALELCRSGGITDAAQAQIQARLGWLLVAEKRADAAVRAFTPAIATFQRLKTSDPEQCYALFGLGTALLHQGRASEAVPYLERAVAAQPPGELHTLADRAQSARALAEALALSGGSGERACALAGEAAVVVRAMPRHEREMRNTDLPGLERWLAEHHCPAATRSEAGGR